MKENDLSILLWDIETAPNLAWVWDFYEQNVISIEKERKLLSFAYKWLGKDKIYCYSLRDYKEKELLQKIHKLFNEADIIVGHNGDKFDIKMVNAFFIHNKMKPPELYKTVDTLKIARSKFKFNSNRLNDIANYLGVGSKLKTGGFELWLGCINNDPKAWNKMIRYNKQDVTLLEKIYLKLKPWGANQKIYKRKNKCPHCGGTSTMSRGWDYRVGYKQGRHSCNLCGKYFPGERVKYK